MTQACGYLVCFDVKMIKCDPWFQTFAVFWMLYAFFWVIPRRLNFICRRFGTLCQFHLHRTIGMKKLLHTYPPMKMEQSVPKRRHIKSRRRGITQKKAYNIKCDVTVDLRTKCWSCEGNVVISTSVSESWLAYRKVDKKGSGLLAYSLKSRSLVIIWDPEHSCEWI